MPSKKPAKHVETAKPARADKAKSTSAKKAADKATPRKMGRPSMYSEAIVAEICARVADGQSLRTIEKVPGLPTVRTIFDWLADESKSDFAHRYARAKSELADKMAEDIIEIADDGKNDTYIDDNGNVRTDYDVIARSKLRVDARKWVASKLAPTKYGEKVETTVKGDADNPLSLLLHQISGASFKPRDGHDSADD